jgi:hypothetical protein
VKLRLVLGPWVLSLAACPAGDAPEGEASSSSSSPGTTGGPSSTATTDDAQTSTEADTGKPEGSAGETTGATTGEAGCGEGRDPAVVTEVDGCGEPIGEPLCSEGQAHVEDGTEIVWESNPPHSGPHYPMWETWGEHEETVPRGNWVHNLEHGGIVLAYLCPDDCPAELDVLRQVIAQRPEERILMTSDPELGTAGFAAISWTWLYTFDSPDLDTLLCFVDQHEGNAPEDVP